MLIYDDNNDKTNFNATYGDDTTNYGIISRDHIEFMQILLCNPVFHKPKITLI